MKRRKSYSRKEAEILQWYANLEKDEELANKVDMATDRMRQGLKLTVR